MAEAAKDEEPYNKSSDQKRNKKFRKLKTQLSKISASSGSGGFTPTRGDAEGHVQMMLTSQLADWISHTCTLDPKLTAENLWENVRDGIILCKFASILTGSKPKKLHSRRACAKSDLMCHDNVIQFLDMVEDYTIPTVRFDSVQLVEGKNYKAVNNCLLYISVEIAKRGIVSLDELPPETAKLYEKWLKKKKKKKKKKASSPEVSVHIDEVEHPAPFAGLVHQGASDSHLETELITLDDLSMDSATDDEDTDATSDMGTDETPEDIPEPTKAVNFDEEAKEPKQKKKKKRKRRRTAYGFTAKDELDQKIMDAFDEISAKTGARTSNVGFGGIAIKKLRRTGEFQIGDSKRKTYIRENNGKLFVRVGGGWENLQEWFQRHIEQSASVGNTGKVKRMMAASKSIEDGSGKKGKPVGNMSTRSLHF